MIPITGPLVLGKTLFGCRSRGRRSVQVRSNRQELIVVEVRGRSPIRVSWYDSPTSHDPISRIARSFRFIPRTHKRPSKRDRYGHLKQQALPTPTYLGRVPPEWRGAADDGPPRWK